MATQSASQAVAAGATTITIAGAFAATYQVGITTGWVTTWRVTSKTATQFTVDFGTPAPAGGSTLDWTAGAAVSPGSSATQTMTAAATTVTITGTFANNYQVALGPAWLTDCDVVSQTPTSFTVNLSVPVPGGGSTLDWIVTVLVNTLAAITATVPIAGASQTITAGATSLTVTTTGSLPGLYEVTLSPSWVTAYDVVTKTATGFVINFAVPVPASGGTVYWTIWGPAIGTVTLADHLDELRDLLHDPNDRFWSATQKAKYINRALMRRDIDTGGNRQLITFTLTAGTGLYTFSQVGNGRVFDVIAINLIFGAQRLLLRDLPKTELDMKFRPWTSYQSQPWAFARYGDRSVYIAPTPNVAYSTEWDCTVYSAPLINLTDLDPLSYPLTQPVPYYAAHLAKVNEHEADEAAQFLDEYQTQLGIATNGRVGRVPDHYTGQAMRP